MRADKIPPEIQYENYAISQDMQILTIGCNISITLEQFLIVVRGRDRCCGIVGRGGRRVELRR